jgi:hypothetical protein
MMAIIPRQPTPGEIFEDITDNGLLDIILDDGSLATYIRIDQYDVFNGPGSMLMAIKPKRWKCNPILTLWESWVLSKYVTDICTILSPMALNPGFLLGLTHTKNCRSAVIVVLFRLLGSTNPEKAYPQVVSMDGQKAPSQYICI